MTISFRTVRNLGLSAMVLIIVILGLVSFVSTAKVIQSLSAVVIKERPILDRTMSIREDFLDAKDIFFAFTRGEESDITQAVTVINEAIKISTELKNLVKKERKEHVAEFITAAKRFKVAVVTYAEEFEYDPTGATATDMEHLAITTVQEADQALNKMINDIRARIRAADINMLIVAKTNQKVIWSGILIGIVVGLLVALFMGRALARPIRQLADGTQRIAKGDLSFEVKVESADELGQLANSFNKMTEDLKQSRDELVAAKDYNDNIIKSMIDTLIVVNPQGIIITVNQATKELLGYEEEELVGKPVDILFAGEKEELIFKGKEQEVLIKEGAIRNYDMNYRTKNGDIIPVSFSGAVMKNKEGKLVGIVGIARDMREIKRLENQLIRTEKLASIGKLAAGVAHEINNPLNVIYGHAEMLAMESRNKEVKKATKVTMQQVKRAAAITDRLLQFSRQRKTKFQPLDINSILKDVFPLLEHQTKHQKVTITTQLSSSLPKVIGDSTQIQEVFLNIIINAIQAMPNGGKLIIRTFTKKIGFGKRKTDIFKQGDTVVVIELEDSGKGIPEDKLQKVFDPFFSTKEQGTGLGLSICHGIIEAHRGTIEAQSKVGEGTTFIIQLPVQREKGTEHG